MATEPRRGETGEAGPVPGGLGEPAPVGVDPPGGGGGRLVGSWAALLVGWGLSRALLVAIGLVNLPFYPKGTLAFDDLTVYARWLPILGAGHLPTDDMWQYPPLSGFFFLLGAIGPDAEAALLAAIVAVDLLLTIVLGHHQLRAGWYWVMAGLLIGPVLVSRFDVVPALFAVLAVLAAARPARVGIWAAVGAALKVWPVLLLVVVPRREALRAGAAFVGVTLVCLVAAALAFEGLSGFLGGQGNRGLQVESVGGLPFLIINTGPAHVDMAYRYGSMEIAADGAGIAATIVTVLLLGLFVWVAVAWWRGILQRSVAADVAFTVVLFSVVFSRVFSPQYSVWLLALGVLCLVTPGSKLRIPVLMVAAAAAMTQILYPYGYGRMLAGDALMVTIQTIRVTLVVAAAVWCGRRVLLAPARRADEASETGSGASG